MKINEKLDTKPHPDANGNIAAVTSPFRALAAKFSYDAFGRTVTQTGSKSGIDIHALNYRFSTKPMELELATSNSTLVPPPASSGLYYYGYRFYSPNMGRWINKDKLDDVLQQKIKKIGNFAKKEGFLDRNHYRFCINNPNQYIDLYGEGFWDWFRTVIGYADQTQTSNAAGFALALGSAYSAAECIKARQALLECASDPDCDLEAAENYKLKVCDLSKRACDGAAS